MTLLIQAHPEEKLKIATQAPVIAAMAVVFRAAVTSAMAATLLKLLIRVQFSVS